LRFRCSEHAEQAATLLRANNLDMDHGHEIDSARDLVLFLEARLGIAILPESTSIPTTLARSTVSGIDLRPTLYVYAAAGRQRSAPVATILKLLRAADRSRCKG